MKQIVFIHGGDSFESYEEYFSSLKNGNPSIEWFLFRKRWIENVAEDLGGEFQFFAPHMPNKQNAKYEEWKIWFEKMLPFITDGVILIGHSQGGIFLAKYLSENIYPKKIRALMLVAAPHSETPEIGSFKLEKPLSDLNEQCRTIHLFQSTDDPVVPFSELDRYAQELPDAQVHIFKDREHFNQEAFPEIVAEIRKMM